MTAKNHNPEKWLVAGWPGMGNVAVLAGGYLVNKLAMKPAGELPPRGHFDVQGVMVRGGVIEPPRLPRSLFFRPQEPGSKADLTVFLGEAQPTSGIYAFAHELLDKAQELGIKRVVTFASMASQLHPSKEPAVHGVATHADLLGELQRLEVRPLQEGEISGLNGVLLGAAADRGMQGLCLMGEIPFFAAGVPNPKAAKAVLDAFALLAGIELDLTDLSKDAAKVDRALVKLLQRLQEKGITPGEETIDLEPGDEEEDEPEAPAASDAPSPSPPEQHPPQERKLELSDRRRIEGLFEQSRRDRTKALELKNELDRLGVYTQYENRFLDLFKRAE